MAQFTSSAKTLTYYADTNGIQRLGQAFGNRLEKLTQEEKYQLCTVIGAHLWTACGPGNEDDDDDLLQTGIDVFSGGVFSKVKDSLVILQHEDPEILAQLLPAIAEYARDDDR